MESEDLRKDVEQLKIAQATQVATTAGAQATGTGRCHGNTGSDPGRPHVDHGRRQCELNHRHLLGPHDRQVEGLAAVQWSAWTTGESKDNRGPCGLAVVKRVVPEGHEEKPSVQENRHNHERHRSVCE